MITVSDFKQMFTDQIDTSHIKYDRDGGHTYSYIEHPLMTMMYEQFSDEEVDELEDFTNDWLYDNDECPPCGIGIDHENKQIGSGCGCHDHLDYDRDREEWESIVSILTEEDY